MTASAGYSGTALAKKLGIKEGSRVCVMDAPKDYAKLVAPLPKGVQLVSRIDAKTDIVHLFATERARLGKALQAALGEELQPAAAIWVSWPKKASKVATDITENTVRELALPLGLVDIKVCAVDQVWSGLKLVVRKENRAPRR
jgi:hypothetical protein